MKKILEQLTALQVKMPLQTIILVLIIAFLLAMIIYFTYKFTFNGVLYNQRFNISLVMITMVTTMVMIVIGTNISVSLGMVGALSIVRFRTAVKDPRDTAFIFWGIVVGLACGTQNYYIAVFGTLVICLILFGFKRFVFPENRYVLIIKGTDYDYDGVDKYLKKTVKGCECKGKYINNNVIELIYNIKFKKSVNNEVVEKLRNVQGIEIVNLVQNNSETMG